MKLAQTVLVEYSPGKFRKEVRVETAKEWREKNFYGQVTKIRNKRIS